MVFKIFWNIEGYVKLRKSKKTSIFGIFSTFYQVFRCFHAWRSKEKLFLVKNAIFLTPWWPIFRNPGGVPGCLFLLHRYYTENFAFLSEKFFSRYPEKNFFTRNIGHAPSYRLVSWSTDFSTSGVFKIAKWLNSNQLFESVHITNFFVSHTIMIDLHTKM